MAGTYWLTILPETSRLESGILASLNRVGRGAVITPRFDTSGAGKAGQAAGRDIRGGVEGEVGKGGGLGRLLRIDGARSTGAQAGADINSGLQSANVGSGLDASVEQNMGGGESLGRRFGSGLLTGLKATAVVGAGVAAAGIGGALKSGFSRLTAIDDATFKLQGLGNTTESVKSIMDNALAAVDKTAFGLDEAATTAATAVAAGVKPGEELTKYLKTTADAAGIAGTSMGEMGQIFNNVQTSGKAFTGELNQLASRGLPIFTWLQKEYNVTGEQLSKMVSDGKVDAATFQKVIAENIGGAAVTMGGSITGSVKNMRAAYSRFGAQLAGPLLAGMVPFVGAFTSVFNDITKAIKPIMGNMTAMITPWATKIAGSITEWSQNGGIQNIVTWFGQLQDKIAGLTSGGGGDAFNSITSGAKGLGDAFTAAGPALTGIGTALGAFGQAIIQVGPATISAILVPAVNLLAGALRFLADNAGWAVPLMVTLVGAFVLLRSTASVLAPMFNAWSAVTSAFRTPLVIAQTMAIRQQAAAMAQLSISLGTNTTAQNLSTVSGNAATATTIRGRVAAIGHAIATRAQALATRAAAAGQWLLNAALTANPIGLIIAGLVAVGVAIWAFFTKTETGRKMWAVIWTGIKTVAGAVWEWLKGALHTVGEVITWLWQNIAMPAFEGIGAVISGMWSITKTIWGALTTAVQWVGDKISWLWQNIAVPAFEAIGGAISNFWKGAQIIWDTFITVIGKVGDKVGEFKDGLVNAFNTVKDVVMAVWDKIGGIIEKIGAGIGKVGDFLKGAGGAVLNAVGLGGGANGGRVVAYAGGGRISGPGGGRSDSILGYPAMVAVSNGEYIVNAASTAKYLPLLQALNTGSLPGFAAGGLTPHASEIKGVISQMFGISNIGGYREPDGYNEHSTGNALDVMIPDSQSDKGIALGNSVAAWAMKNAKAIGLTGMIWRQTSYGYGSGFDGTGKPMEDRGNPTANHFDHVHMFMNDKPDTSISLTGASSMSSSVGSATSASGSAYRAATDAELSSSSNKVDSANKAVTQAQQSVDDKTFSRDRKQARLNELKAAGKDTTDAQHALDVANRELADANTSLAEKRTKAGDAETADTELRTKGKLDKVKADSGKGGKGGADGSDFGKMFVSGLLESVGLDGSLFSNPLEWPTVKSAMAGVNFLGGMLSGGGTEDTNASPGGFAAGAADSVGLGGLLSAIPKTSTALDLQSGSPALAPGEVNPAVAGAVDPSTAGSMSAFAPADQAGAAPAGAVDNSININGNVGMNPSDVIGAVHNENNARTRTTVRR